MHPTGGLPAGRFTRSAMPVYGSIRARCWANGTTAVCTKLMRPGRAITADTATTRVSPITARECLASRLSARSAMRASCSIPVS